MTASETARFFDRYAARIDAPVREHAEVVDVAAADGGFCVATTTGTFGAANVVIATGWCDRPATPAAAADLAPRINQVTPNAYRNPHQLAPGGVLVVGASATGIQLADEFRRAGRRVMVAVGSHQRMPRTYRGMDSFWWLDQLGVWDRTIDDVDDAWAARTEPALQLVGRPDHATLDLHVLQRRGVELVGRFAGAEGTTVHIRPDLAATTADADARLSRLLSRIDRAIDVCGLAGEVSPAEPIQAVRVTSPADTVDLVGAGITNVVWATGYRRSYPWLRLPVLDRRGEIAQYRGVTHVPGAYVLGQRFQHFRNSNFIDGVGRDAGHVADHIAARSNQHRGASLHDPIGGRS